MDYLPLSYRTFANNGTVNVNGNINAASNTALSSLTNRTTILNLLTTVSDHLPVVVDYVYYPVNRAPTDITISSSSFSENAAIGLTVGSLSTIDPDLGNTFTYSLVAGTGSSDNALFAISGSQLRAQVVANFEVRTGYFIRLETRDQSGATFQKAMVIAVTNVNEAPTAISLSSQSVAENLGFTTAFATFTVTDPDAGNTFTTTFVSGVGSTDNALFSISGNQLRTNAVFDFETRSTYSIRVRSQDQGNLGIESTFTIQILNANDAPTAFAGGPYSIERGQSLQLAGSGIDQDTNQSLSYAWDLNYDGLGFQIDATGATPSVLFAAAGAYTIAIRATDNGSPSRSHIATATVQVSEPPIPPKVQNVIFGEDPTQRSMVRRIDVVFDSKVTVDANAFILEKRVASSSGVTYVPYTASQLSIQGSDIGTASQSTFRLSFTGSTVMGGSLEDGYYRLTIDSSKVRSNQVTLDGNGDGVAGGNFFRGEDPRDRFFRLLGDMDGNAAVGVLDFARFRSAYGSVASTASYVDALDFQRDGSIGVTDFALFRSRYGSTLRS